MFFSRLKPLHVLAGAVAISLLCNPQLTLWISVGVVAMLAYAQNIAYTPQSRASVRSSNAYHLFASLLASFTYFASFRYLLLREMPLVFLPAYMLGTVSGSSHGMAISQRIEQVIGAHAEAPKGQSQWARFWPSLVVLVVLLLLQVFLLADRGMWLLLAYIALQILDSFSFSFLRFARNLDHYWLHTGAALFQGLVKFLGLAILISMNVDWALFLPSATGSMIGSLVGANSARRLADWLQAKTDAHVLGDTNIAMPYVQIASCVIGLGMYGSVVGRIPLPAFVFLFGSSIAMAMSFTIVSRARQRGHKKFLEWASLASNSIWYLTMGQLVVQQMSPQAAGVYLAGNTIGSLTGQSTSMHIEKKIGALMDDTSGKRPVRA